VVFAKVVLEPEGERDETAIAISQSQKSRAEAILGIAHVCCRQYSKPFFGQSHQLVVCLRSQLFEIHILYVERQETKHNRGERGVNQPYSDRWDGLDHCRSAH